MQAMKPDLLLGIHINPCTQVLASRLNIPFVSLLLAAPIEPLLTSLWPGSNRRAFLPNPLSYYPQLGMQIASQHMVSSPAPGLCQL